MLKNVVVGLLLGSGVFFSAKAVLNNARATSILQPASLMELPKETVKVQSSAPASGKVPVYKVQLNAGNTLSLRLPVSSNTMGTLQVGLLELSKKLPSNAKIFLILDTPGGSVDAGNKFIDISKTIPQEIVTITRFAASMGFQIVQNLGTRFILPHGQLMSHNAHIEGFGGDVPGNGLTRFNALLRDLALDDLVIAQRLGLTFEAYRDMIKAEYWVTGTDAVRDRAADAIVLPTCDASFQGTHKETISTVFGEVAIVFANCPLVSEPLETLLSAASKQKEAQDALKRFATELFEERDQFIQHYIKTGLINKYMK